MSAPNLNTKPGAKLCNVNHLVMQRHDVELASRVAPPLRGFALVASKIVSDADRTTTLYRRFDELAARNLLLYQAELEELEEQLRDFDRTDSQLRDERSVECQHDFAEFERCAEENVTREKEKMILMMKIRSRLEIYRQQ